MSNFQALGLIIATLVPGYFAILYANKVIHDRADDVVTGVVRGLPMSARHRGLMLFNELLPTVFGLALFSFLMAIAYLQIAGHVSDADLRLFAYLCAGAAGFASFFTVVLGGMFLFYCASVLRQAKRD